MVWFLFAEIFILFLLSRMLTVAVSKLFYALTGSERLSVWMMSLLFSPGTIIHEMSHFLVAKVLFVRTGKINLLPVYHGNSLRLGSVEVAKADFIRNFFIGVAPFITGVSIILFLLFLILENLRNGTLNYIFLFALLYIVFAVSNTMFSSRKDLEGALEFLILLVVVLGILYLNGLDPIKMISAINVGNANQILLVPIGIDIVLITLFSRFRD